MRTAMFVLVFIIGGFALLGAMFASIAAVAAALKALGLGEEASVLAACAFAVAGTLGYHGYKAAQDRP